MPGPTTAALEQRIIALRERLEAAEHDLRDLRHEVAALRTDRAGEKPWIDLMKRLAYMALCGAAGAALAKLFAGQ